MRLSKNYCFCDVARAQRMLLSLRVLCMRVLCMRVLCVRVLCVRVLCVRVLRLLPCLPWLRPCDSAD